MNNPRTYKDCNIHEKINFKSWFNDTFLLRGVHILQADCSYHYAACSEPRYSNECWSNNKVGRIA